MDDYAHLDLDEIDFAPVDHDSATLRNDRDRLIDRESWGYRGGRH